MFIILKRANFRILSRLRKPHVIAHRKTSGTFFIPAKRDKFPHIIQKLRKAAKQLQCNWDFMSQMKENKKWLVFTYIKPYIQNKYKAINPKLNNPKIFISHYTSILRHR